MDPRTASLRCVLQARVGQELMEGGVDAGVGEPGAPGRDEEARHSRAGAQLVPLGVIARQRLDRGVMAHELPGAPELRAPHGEHPLGPVDVVAVEAHRLPDAHARDREQADQDLEGGSP